MFRKAEERRGDEDETISSQRGREDEVRRRLLANAHGMEFGAGVGACSLHDSLLSSCCKCNAEWNVLSRDVSHPS